MLAFLFPALFLWTFTLQAQSTSVYTVTLQPVKKDSVYHLEEWVLPASLTVTAADTAWPASYWQYEAATGNWRLAPAVPDSMLSPATALTLHFRVLPLHLKRSYSLRRLQPADTSYRAAGGTGEKVARRTFTEQDLFGDVQLDKSGSLTRGITVGSNKDLSLESGLRFDLNGKLSDNVNILATLTDKSTPIQPDGSTQNLREFDRVFIQMQTPSSRVQLGDVDLHFDRSEFARISRRLQGAQAMTQTKVGNYQGAFSVARGRYKSMKLSGRDGLQGPYRLSGQQGEEFIIVLAGTERVYIDGERVQRGEENDYIIDYGLGELTFTNRQIMTDETRITVDFQYINRDFSRSLVAAEGSEDSLLGGRLSLSTTVIREADSDNLANQPSLTEKDIAVLRQAGDNLDAAVVSGADSVGRAARNDFVLYTRIDTTYNGQPYTIYRHLPGGDRNVYRVRFSRVEAGQGAYRRVGREVNGILYEWVGPGNGDYSARRRLVAPQKHQMVALHSRYRLNRHVQLFGEWAGSDYDLNRFSSLDDGDNFDQAYLAGTRIRDLHTSAGTFSAEIRQRYSGKRFRYFDRTRPVEFDRKWNITRDIQTRERITEASASWEPAGATALAVGFGRIDRSDIESRRQEVSLHSAEEGLPQLRYRLEYIDSRDALAGQQGRWLRQQGRSRYTWHTGLGDFSPSFRYEAEDRRQRALDSDTLTALSLQFFEVGPGLEWQSGRWTLGTDWSYREDRRPLNRALRPSSSGLTERFRLEYEGGSTFNTSNEVAFRRKNYTQAFESGGAGRDSRGVFIRSASNYATGHQLLKGQVLYEANTERRALLQETYLEVGPEQGQYVWNDLNNDGLQQIDEFFQELSPNEGRFVKQYIPSDELFPVIDLHTRLRNTAEPGHWLEARGADGVLAEVLKRLKLHSLIEIRESNTTRRLSDIYLMRLNTFRNDSTTIDGNLYWQQALELFPENSRVDIRLQYHQMRGLSRKAIGSERRYNDGWKLNESYRFQRYYTLRLALEKETDRNLNQRLITRNYNIARYSVRPGFDVLFNRSLQAGLALTWTHKKDRFPRDPVRVQLFKTEVHSRAYLFDRLQVNSRIAWRSVAMKGQSSALGIYELTEGAGRGNSWVWSLRGTYRINNLVRASVDYDGRTVRNNSPIQTLRIIVSAVF